MTELSTWTMKASTHIHVKNIQRDEIKDAEEEAKSHSGSSILHGDFAEKWKVITKNEIQSAYWKTNQVSIFTAVWYCGDETKSFSVVSDDTTHDTAHAISAMNCIVKHLEESPKFQEIKQITIVSDGASAHFKNRYQFHEFRKSSINEKWLFSATGHGKGACDGIGGLVKHFATDHNLTKSQLESIDDTATSVSEVKKLY